MKCAKNVKGHMPDGSGLPVGTVLYTRTFKDGRKYGVCAGPEMVHDPAGRKQIASLIREMRQMPDA